MKELKHSSWAYAGLVLMLLALLSFSFFPVVSSLLQTDSSPTTVANSPMPQNRAGKLETEANGYQVVLEREPDNENALRGLLQARLEQGNLQAAIEPLAHLAQLNPQIADYSLLLAQAQQQLGDAAGAEQAYRSLLETQPKDIRALKGLTDLWLSQGRAPEAISLVQRRLTQGLEQEKAGVSANLISLQLLLGEIYVAQQRYDEALPLYDLAIAADRADFRPVLAKAMLLQQQGKVKEAEPLWQQAIDRAPVQYKDRIKGMAGQISPLPAKAVQPAL
jgi:tetratricopeptide (TPR) repeat protein